MNLENLKTGERYKYKDLCLAFGFQPATGNTKKKHLTTFEQYLNIEKDGTWFMIHEIYDSPREREDGRKFNMFTEQHVQESFFTKDELQLAVLWILGIRAFNMPKQHEKTNGFCIPTKELYVAVGLCNEFYNMMAHNKFYYTKRRKEDDGVFWKWQVDIAFKHLYNDMKNRTITAFNQLQRNKVLEFSYWKCLAKSDGFVAFTDEQMDLFLEKRDEALDWWNSEHGVKYATVGKFYERATTKDIKEFEHYLKVQMSMTGKFKDFRYYTSCFKVHYTLKSVQRELADRGYKVDTKEEFMDSFRQSMEQVVARINTKFIERHEGYLIKERDKHFDTFYEYVDGLPEPVEVVDDEPRKGFGRVRKIEERTPKPPFHALTDSELYEETKEVMLLGMKLKDDLNEYEKATLQAIEFYIQKHNKEEQNKDSD